MVQVSYESAAEIDQRLRQVIAKAEMTVHEGTFAFEEFPLSEFGEKANAEALAIVRDSEVWSQLIPSSNPSQELFTIFSFHFPNCEDNSGFVGWLASHLKQKLGTGVFVTCGQNSNKGGIFDYWGCPASVAEVVLSELNQLRKQS